MNIKSPTRILPACLAAVALLATVALTTANAQTDLQPRVVLRPLTPAEITDYGLPDGTERSGGLANVGVGTAVYLEADVNIDFPASNIVSVAWTATNNTAHVAVALEASPLGTNVPVYGPSDQLVYKVAEPGGRMVLRPMMDGQYTATATITTTTGTTNISQLITASTYMGLYTCSLCHDGGVAPNKVEPWSKTGHASMFSEAIDGLKSSHYNSSCIECHTVGYDTNTNAVNGGFDDVATQLGWTFPTNLVVGNWASMQSNYPSLANLANIQCENCHGPGYNHAQLLGMTNNAAWPSIAISYNSGVCAQCHDEPNNHIKVAEWDNSVHAITTRHPSGPGEEDCVRCHTGLGFIQYVKGVTNNIDATYVPIDCQACHDPHGQTLPGTNSPNQYLIRTLASVTFEDGTVVTNGGEGQLCMNCHHARQDAATYATSYHSHFGPHHGPQGDMLEGVNGFTYGENIPSSAHANAVPNTCVTCHMQTVSSSDAAFLHAGGHTFKPNWEAGDVDLVGACQQCHGPSITDFDFPLQDYNGDGVIQGVQTEVQELLNKLSTLLPNSSGVVDGQVKTPSPTASWTVPELEADYNWQFVNNDGSLGIHNTAYAVGLLKASIANLTGDANNDGLPDAWQTNYFGTINNPLAAPNAINNTNNVPNWMMYALGLDPRQSGITVPGGVVWMDGSTLVNSGATNTVHIYTAAEISFNTVDGTAYQIQGISNLSGGWQNIGNVIVGTGQPVSYLTPTRNNAQMFFRVITNPTP